MTIEKMTSVEPDIGAILQEAAQAQGDKTRLYEAYKRRLSTLVGWGARNAMLATPVAYSTAIRALCTSLDY